MEASLAEILTSRENRANMQKCLIKEYNCPIISFTMNIAGPKKNSPKIKRAFEDGLFELCEKLEALPVKYKKIEYLPTGNEAYFAVDALAKDIKNICVSIENSSNLGRLFDMDVINTDGKKLERENPNERGCLVCGKKSRECAAGRLHTVEELQKATDEIIDSYFIEKDAEIISQKAVQSLIDEVNTTPKPGLVDKRNSGSHSDMTRDTFYKSAFSIKNYFAFCVKIGQKSKNADINECFSLLREAGKNAEKQMYNATGGINTHKGIIFSLGIICASIGMLWTAENGIARYDEISKSSAKIAKIAQDLDFSGNDISTAGQRLYKSLGIKGVRGEAANGFPSVFDISLPAFIRAKKSGFSKNYAGVYALINLISEVYDTNIYSRGGESGAVFAKNYAKRILEENIYPKIEVIEKMDDDFIAKNLSPGGCADLLALTYFLDSIK